jgi:hypothetical protein
MKGWFTVKKSFCVVLLLILVLFMTSCENSNRRLDTSQNNIATNTVISSGSILDVKIVDISFYDEKGKKLTNIDGWIHVHKNTKIVVSYEGNADQIDFIFVPAGTEMYTSQTIIGYSLVGPNDKKAEFIWAPSAEQSLGYIIISINQCRYSLKSDSINVITQ